MDPVKGFIIKEQGIKFGLHGIGIEQSLIKVAKFTVVLVNKKNNNNKNQSSSEITIFGNFAPAPSPSSDWDVVED